MTPAGALRCLRLDAHRHPPQADAHAVVPQTAKVLRGPRRPDAVPLRRRAAWACPSSPEIEFTNTVRGLFHPYGTSRASGCRVTSNPGPDVRGSPSFWYFAAPIAFNRFAKVRA
ncbi:hypothetical protein GCM10010272_65260 [Streptomyces lateritius]|nr:hypothetical protein GCM10010272_65260 [Streptomyces lateritius]